MDIVIDYKDLVGDKQVEIQVKNTDAKLYQYSLVQILMHVVNMFSPVKFQIYFD